MTNIVNLTPHDVVVGGITYPKPEEGTILPRVQEASEPVHYVDISLPEGFTARRVTKSGVMGLPREAFNTLYIVSAMVREAVPHRRDVVSPDTGSSATRNEKGHIIGVTGFIFN